MTVAQALALVLVSLVAGVVFLVLGAGLGAIGERVLARFRCSDPNCHTCRRLP